MDEHEKKVQGRNIERSVGYAVAGVMLLCVAAIIIALTVKFIAWMF